MAATIKNLLLKFRESSCAVKILWINILLFVLLRVAGAVSVISGHEEWIDSILGWSVEVPSDLRLLLLRPWVLLTYMFAQYEVWHALFNMLLFYWFATIFLNIASSRRLWTLYISSGLAGALCFIVFSNIFPGFSGHTGWLIGSSAAVLGVITATSLLCPDFSMMLFFIGEVKLKWVGLATILLTLAGGISGGNYGGNLAHVGGIIAGVIYAFSLHRSFTPSFLRRRSKQPVSFGPSIAPPFTPRRPVASTYRQQPPQTTPTNKEDIEKLDAILDKIKVSGYAALSPSERKILFEVSSRIK